MLHRLALAYFGGAVAAVVASLALWLAARARLLDLIGVALAPRLGWGWLGPRVIWGSLLALPYPFLRSRALTPTRAGLVLAAAVGALELAVHMPRQGLGFLGLSRGPLTPVVVLAASALWGWTLSRVVRASGGP